jgi:hypothetical protein
LYRGLQELEIGGILGLEQTDVRRVLLADSPFASAPGARTRLQAQKEPKAHFARILVSCLHKTENLELMTES